MSSQTHPAGLQPFQEPATSASRRWVGWFAVAALAWFAPVMADEVKKDASEWIVSPGFSLVEAQGEFNAPVAMAFPKNDGKPTDIQYLVTELRGRIVAITNEGKKLVVQEVDEVAHPKEELPQSGGEVGLGGMCFSPDQKYLFTTAVIQSGFSIHNSVSRWEAVTPGDWSKIQRTAYLKDLFLGDTSTKSHNIGHCVTTADGNLIFGTGDGGKAAHTHLSDSTNGKLYRVKFDFSGAPDNPFFDPARPNDLKSLYYASGLRNPWSLTAFENEIFVVDNGPSIDRLLHIQKGRDYPWSGSDISMTYDNELSFSPPIGPSGVVFVPWNHKIESLRGHLLITASHAQEVLAVPMTPDFKVAGDWKKLVSPTNPKIRTSIAGIFLHGDDIFITHIRVRQNPITGIIPSNILKLVPSNQVTGPVRLTGEALVQTKGCRACHVFIGRGGIQGPNLDELIPRLEAQLSSKEYLADLGKLQLNTSEPDHDKWVKLRKNLIDQKGPLDQRIDQWISAKIEHPQFNSTSNVMPALGLTPDEIKEMTRYLTLTSDRKTDGVSWHLKLRRRLISNPAPLIAGSLVIGIAGGFLIGRMRRRKQA